MTRQTFLAGSVAGALIVLGVSVVIGAAPAAATPPVAGTLLVADPTNHRVVEIAPGGAQQNVPVTGLGQVGGVTADGAGNIYISDPDHARIVKVPGDGSAQIDIATGLIGPLGLTADGWGNIFVTTNGAPNNSVLKVAPDGTVSTVYCCPGPGTRATDVAVDDGGRYTVAKAHYSLHDEANEYVAIPDFQSVIKIVPGDSEDDTTTEIFNIHAPTYLTVDANHRVYVSYPSSGLVLSGVDSGSRIDNLTYFDEGLDNPQGVAVDDANGNLYVADKQHNYVVKFAPDGSVLSEIAVTGANGLTAVALVPPTAPPAVRISAPADSAAYDFGAEPDADFGCTPGVGATLASCSASIDGGPAFASGTPLTDGGGQHTMTVTGTDSLGHTSSASVTYQISASGPAVVMSTPVDGTLYLRGSVPPVVFSCTAGPGGTLKPGLDGCYATVDGGAPIASGSPLPDTGAGHTVVAYARNIDDTYRLAQAFYGLRSPPPIVTLITPVDNGVYHAGSMPNVEFSCTAGTGAVITNCGAGDGGNNYNSGDPLKGFPGHQYDFTAFVVQSDGQFASETHTYTVRTGLPVVTVTSPTEGAEYVHGVTPTADFSCAAGVGGTLLGGTDGCSMSIDGGAPIASGATLPNSQGAHTAVVTATEVDGSQTSVTRHYTVQATNRRPIARNDSLNAPLDKPGSVNVLANDIDPDSDPTSLTGHTTPLHGTVTCAAAGTCTYTPTHGYTGYDHFSYTVSDSYSGTDTGRVAVTVGSPGGALRVSSFRLAGAGGGADEYVELTNVTKHNVILGGGWRLRWQTSSGSTLFALNGGTLPPGGRFLIGGGGYSFDTTPDQTLPADIPDDPGGLQVRAPDGTVSDAVGFVTARAGYREGRGVTSPARFPQNAFVRAEQDGTLVDTGDNVRDFALVAKFPDLLPGSQLGNPEPDNSASPLPANATLKSALLDSSVASTAAPNREITGSIATNDEQLRVRRTITNTGTTTVTGLRIRLTSISTAGVPGRHAALRWIDSADGASSGVSWKGLAVDPTLGGDGGGLRSRALVPLPPGGLAPGASVSVEFCFAVDVGGRYWFTYDVDAAV